MCIWRGACFPKSLAKRRCDPVEKETRQLGWGLHLSEIVCLLLLGVGGGGSLRVCVVVLLLLSFFFGGGEGRGELVKQGERSCCDLCPDSTLQEWTGHSLGISYVAVTCKMRH